MSVAHVKMDCPLCGKNTSIYVTDESRSYCEVKCEHCRNVFAFRATMNYSSLGTVSELPHWAFISEKEKNLLYYNENKHKYEKVKENKKKWWQF